MDDSKQLCSEPDCFNNVEEHELAHDSKGNVYARSEKCWNCRTTADRKAIRSWRKKHRS